jgi:hypothetical protein
MTGYAIAGAFAAGPQAGQGCATAEAASVAALARIPRSEVWQEPHWSPIPQRWRSRTEAAPFSMARAMSFSDFPRQMQMITFVRFRSSVLRQSLSTRIMPASFPVVNGSGPHVLVTDVTVATGMEPRLQ